MRIHQLGVLPALLLFAATVAPADPGYSWDDGESRTIEYTPGQYLFVILDTDVPFDGSSVSIVSGAAPAGVDVLDNCLGADHTRCAYFTGTPTVSSVTTITLRMSDGGDSGRSTDITVTFQPAFSLSGTLASPGIVGAAYSSSLTASGGTAPITWSISAGTLPPGLSINSSTGEVSGTPTTAGNYSFTVQALDNEAVSKTSAQSIQVLEALSVTSSSLAEGSVGGSYSQTLEASGGADPKTWSVASGELPAGLSLNGSTGAITGTPSAAGTFNFTVQVDCCTSGMSQRALSIVINPAPEITTTSLPNGAIAQQYSQTLAATDGTTPYAWSITAGALPDGLSLNASTGAITGSPTTAGTANFTVGLEDAAGATDTQALSIEVLDKPTITTTSLDALTVGQTVAAWLTATDGTTPYAWSISAGALPDGLSLNASTGEITGTPTTAGTANFTARVVDTNTLEDTQELSWTVNAAPEITTSSLPQTTINRPLPSATMEATGGTGALTWTATGLPAGVSLSTAGALSGTPTESGSFPVTLKATDTNWVEGTRELTLTVNPPLDITTLSLPRGTVGAEYSRALAATGGTGSYTWHLVCSILPANLTLSEAGVISGVPQAVGGTHIEVAVEDESGAYDSMTLEIEFVEQLEITTTELAPVTVEQNVSVPLAKTGGFSPFTWTITAGSLPAGIAIDEATGALTGVPTAAQTASFTVRVTDADSRTGERSFEWLVNPPVEITTTELSQATAGANYKHQVGVTGGTGDLILTVEGLPGGVNFSPGSRWISGAFGTPGTLTITLKATDQNGVMKTREFELIVSPALRIVTESVPDAERGRHTRFRFRAEGGRPDMTWTGDLPAGTTLRSDGLWLGSPTSVGEQSIRVHVVDANGASDERFFPLLVNEPESFSVQPAELTFHGVEAGGPTPPQQVEITSTPANRAFEAATTADWLAVSLNSSTTPAVLEAVASPEGLEPGEYAAVIEMPGTGKSVSVLFVVAPATEPTLSVTPELLTLHAETAGASVAELAIARTTGGPGPVAAAVQPGADWLSVESRESADGVVLRIVANPAALEAGAYEGTILVTAGDLTVELPVTLNVAAANFTLSHSGLTFEGIAGGAQPPDQELRVLNLGAAPLDWQATSSEEWASVTPPAGNANPLSSLAVGIDTGGLAPGAHSATLTVESPGGVQRTTEVRLNLDDTTVAPQASPTGLLFVSDGGETPAQEITLTNGGEASLGFVQAVSPMEAASWLAVTPSAGTVAGGGSTALLAQVQPAGLAPGLHEAAVSVEFEDGTVRVVSVKLLVKPADCAPTRLLPVFTKLGDHFQARQGWPSAVELLVTDDCGEPVSEGAGLLELSHPGEPAIALQPGPGGLWTGSWTPLGEHDSITATVTVETPDRGLTGTATATGAVTADGLE